MKKTFLKIRVFAVLIIAITAFSSCKKENGNSAGNNGNSIGNKGVKLLPSEITYDTNYWGIKSTTVYKYFYDDKNRLQAIEKVNTTNMNGIVVLRSERSEFIYDAQGKLIKRNGYDEHDSFLSGSCSYSYSGDTVTIIVSSPGGSHSKDVIIVNKKGQMEKYGSHYYFYDEKGNLIKESYSSGYSNYSYDDKNGVYSAINLPSWYFVYNDKIRHEMMMMGFVNNCISEKTYQAASTHEYSYEYYEYEHNYPTKIITTSDSEETTIITIKYIQAK